MYRLIRFGGLDLDQLNQVEDIGSGPTPTSYFALPDGGAIDAYGVVQKGPSVVERSKQMRLRAASVDDLNDLYFKILAYRGKRDQLSRRTSRGDLHWMYARLTEITASRSYEQTRYRSVQDVELSFACQEATWRGKYHGLWFLDTGIYLDTGFAVGSTGVHALAGSPAAITVQVGTAADPGRAPVRAVAILVQAGAAPMSAITIARTGGESLIYSGTIPAGGELVINAGTMQVSCTGIANPYDNLIIAPTADMAAWFALQPGDNSIAVTYTGGGAGASIEFAYYEAWY